MPTSLSMKRLHAFSAIIACLIMPALAIVPDQDDWTVVTMAFDGAWGSATEPSVSQALAKAIGNCKAMSGREIGCGAESRVIQGGWILATRCGDTNILVAERQLADAERAARERETDLREHYARDLPPCRRVLTVNPRGGVMVATSQALDASGLASNTIVVFTSDNGGERFSDTWPFSGMKEELLEGGLRIPSIVRWPGRIAAGTTSEQVMATMDWMPTLLAAAGTSPDAAYPSDGEDLGPILTGRAAPHPRKLYWRYHAGSQRAIRDGNWKYLRIAGNEFLFDVVADPRERANLKDRERDVLARLKGDWEGWNENMLPERPRPMFWGNAGRGVADRHGVTNPTPAAPPVGLPKN